MAQASFKKRLENKDITARKDGSFTVLYDASGEEICRFAGGGGGGSSVAWNQLVRTGTKIAEINIDGTKTDVFAPNGGGSSVSFTQGLTSGPLVGTLVIDGTSYQLHCNEGGGGGGSTVSWAQHVTTGTKIATITINGVPTDVYAPTSGGSNVTYVPKEWTVETESTGTLTINGVPYEILLPKSMIQGDYLKLDGSSTMAGHIKMDSHMILDVSTIKGQGGESGIGIMSSNKYGYNYLQLTDELVRLGTLSQWLQFEQQTATHPDGGFFLCQDNGTKWKFANQGVLTPKETVTEDAPIMQSIYLWDKWYNFPNFQGAYVRVDGTTPMEGDLNCNYNGILNARTIGVEEGSLHLYHSQSRNNVYSGVVLADQPGMDGEDIGLNLEAGTGANYLHLVMKTNNTGEPIERRPYLKYRENLGTDPTYTPILAAEDLAFNENHYTGRTARSVHYNGDWWNLAVEGEYLRLDGSSTMAGNIDVGGKEITNVYYTNLQAGGTLESHGGLRVRNTEGTILGDLSFHCGGDTFTDRAVMKLEVNNKDTRGIIIKADPNNPDITYNYFKSDGTSITSHLTTRKETDAAYAPISDSQYGGQTVTATEGLKFVFRRVGRIVIVNVTGKPTVTTQFNVTVPTGWEAMTDIASGYCSIIRDNYGRGDDIRLFWTGTGVLTVGAAKTGTVLSGSEFRGSLVYIKKE